MKLVSSPPLQHLPTCKERLMDELRLERILEVFWSSCLLKAGLVWMDQSRSESLRALSAQGLSISKDGESTASLESCSRVCISLLRFFSFYNI